MKKIITISREFGSGGKELGKRLAEELGLSFFDSEIINILSKETGLTKEYISNISEKGITNSIHHFGRTFSTTTSNQKMEVLLSQQRVIKNIGEIGNCVIVGRGADVILNDYEPFKIFVYSNIETKIKRCLDNKNDNDKITEKEIIKKIKEIDNNRKKYYDIISNSPWGEKLNYDICINTSNMNIEDLITPIIIYIKQYYGE